MKMIANKFVLLCLMLVLFVTMLISPVAMADEELSQEQQVFMLSIISNGLIKINKNHSESELEQILAGYLQNVLTNSKIQEQMGEWTVDWGPVVYKPLLSRKAANAMYVAHKDDQYVVAVAGTNGTSIYDWFVENFRVGTLVKWPYGDPGQLNPQISQGTDIGLKKLLEMRDPNPNKQNTLNEYLQGIVNSHGGSDLQIIFAGHSLGGALSPVLALAILDQNTDWDSKTISVYPSAGPTPGNEHFSQYYDERLGTTTHRIWNSIDIVPHVWELSMLEKIPAIYEGNGIKSGSFIPKAVGYLETIVQNNNYLHIKPQEQPKPGSVVPLNTNICSDTTETKSSAIASVDQSLSKDKELSELVRTFKTKLRENPELETQLVKLVQSSPEFLETPVDEVTSDKTLELLFNQLSTFLKEAGYQHSDAYATLLNVEDAYCFAKTKTPTDQDYSDTEVTADEISKQVEFVIKVLQNQD